MIVMRIFTDLKRLKGDKMKKEIDFSFEYELWDDNDTIENKSVRFSQIYDEAKSIIENNNNSESWEGTSPSKYWTDKDSYGETDDEKREELTLLFNNFDLKKATFIEMEKFADAWWDYVGGVGSRELNTYRKYYKIDKEEDKKEFSFLNLNLDLNAYRIEILVK